MNSGLFKIIMKHYGIGENLTNNIGKLTLFLLLSCINSSIVKSLSSTLNSSHSLVKSSTDCLVMPGNIIPSSGGVAKIFSINDTNKTLKIN